MASLSKRTTGLVGTINHPERVALAEKLKALIPKQATKSRPPSCTDDEIIRMLAGRRIFMEASNNSSRGMWTYIQQSSLFGFLYGRHHNFLSSYYAKYETSFFSEKPAQMKKAAMWDPKNYSIETMIADWRRLDVEVSAEAIVALKELHAFDMQMYDLWNANREQKKIPTPEKKSVSIPAISPVTLETESATQVSILKDQILFLNSKVAALENRILSIEMKSIPDQTNSMALSSSAPQGTNDEVLSTLQNLISKMDSFLSAQPVKKTKI